MTEAVPEADNSKVNIKAIDYTLPPAISPESPAELSSIFIDVAPVSLEGI